MIGKAIARVITCQFVVWDIADLGVGVAHRRHRALRCGERIYLNLVSSYLCYDTYDQFLALFTKQAIASLTVHQGAITLSNKFEYFYSSLKVSINKSTCFCRCCKKLSH